VAAITERVGHEVERPTAVDGRWEEQRSTRADCPFAAAADNSTYTRNLPLSQLSGATPTSLAISPRFVSPSSGSRAIKLAHNTRPTPGTLRKISCLACHSFELRSAPVNVVVQTL
jgi:hypothetical protein